LRKAFQTRNGRIVYDGKGIKPDIMYPDSTETLLEIALKQQSHYFFFANRYAAEHEQLQYADANSALYQDFRSYLTEEEFGYQTRAEQLFDKMKSELDRSEQLASADPALEDLNMILQRQKELAFEQNRKDITQDLYLELLSRYEGQQGRLKAALTYDPLVKEAIRWLNDPQRMARELQSDKTGNGQ
jgi:carboxyl-terminal processing protease